MSLETTVQDFTEKTEELLTAVNLRKVELDAAKNAAVSSAQGAFNSAATATTKAAEAATSASGAAASKASSDLSRDAAATSAEQAGASAVAAAASAVAASDFETGAGENAAAASAAAADAATAKSGSEAARNASVAARTASEAARDAALTAKTAAETAETNAETAETAAEAAQAAAEAARNAAQTSAGQASASKDAAALSATAAATSATEADADRAAAQTACTGSEAARDAAVLAQTAAETARTAAQSAQTGAQTARTGAETAQTGAQTARTGAELAQIAAAASLASATSQASTASAQASLAAGYAASASSVVQQDLSGITAQALHRSPNSITAMTIYDTSKDSDGGAWTEKCQHTSWWNEPLMGKWLGAWSSEANARILSAPTLGSELITNGTFDADTSGWSVVGSGTIVATAGRLRVTSDGGLTRARRTATVVVGKAYRIAFDGHKGTATNYLAYVGSSTGANDYLNKTDPDGSTVAYFVATTTLLCIDLFCGTSGSGKYSEYDNISVREVTALNTASGDYFQLTTDGKFYRLYKNLLRSSADPSVSHWVKENSSVILNAGIDPNGGNTAFKLVENTVNGAHAVYCPSIFHFPGISYAHSVYAKADGRTKFRIQAQTVNPSDATQWEFDLVAVTATNTYAAWTNHGATITPLPDGWFRCTVYARSPLAGTSQMFILQLSNGSNGYAGDGTSGVLFWRPQVELNTTVASAYEEVPLNTEVFRGNKADFPRLAAIVAESSSVNIYDLTEPGRPMWMRFTAPGSSNALGYFNVSCVAALNGLMIAGSSSFDLFAFNLYSDTALRISTLGQSAVYRGALADRNAGRDWSISNPLTGNIAGRAVNAVAMIALPDAPLDSATNLRVPTIAVGTNSGVSVIKHNGSVVSTNSTGVFSGVSFTGTTLMAYRTGDGNFYYATNIGSVAASFNMSAVTGTFAQAYNNKIISSGRSFTKGHTGRAFNLRLNTTLQAQSLANEITTAFNTGWIPGDIRRAYLSDTEVGSVTGVELVTNSGFDTDLSGWTVSNVGTATTTWENGRARMVNPASSNYSTLSQVIPTVAGRTYRLQITSVYFSGYPDIYINLTGVGNLNAGTRVAYFTASGSTTNLAIQIAGNFVATMEFDNISVREFVADRSYKVSSAILYGSLTKAQLASGTSLVGYSGFSASNYLREPYSADLDFGTGEWSCSAWVNVPMALTGYPTTGNELISNGTFDTDISGWIGGDASWDSGNGGRMKIYSATNGFAFAYTSITTVVGKKYLFSVQATGNGATYHYASPEAPGGGGNLQWFSADGMTPRVFTATSTTTYIRVGINQTPPGFTVYFDNISVKEIVDPIIAERAHSSGPAIRLGLVSASPTSVRLTAIAFDGATTRTVTTSAAYNIAQWFKAEACYTVDGTLSIRVNGKEMATTRGNRLLSVSAVRNMTRFSNSVGASTGTTTNAATGEIFETSENGLHIFDVGNISTTQYAEMAGGVYNTQFKTKANGRSLCSFIHYPSSVGITLDYSTGVATVYGGGSGVSNISCVLQPDGFYLVSFSSVAVGTDNSFRGYLNAVASYVGDPTKGVIVKNCQIALGSSPSTYVETNGTPVQVNPTPLTIGNNYVADAPFPGSIALLKLSATVPTAEQSQFMYEQEKQLFRPGAQAVLPDSGAIVDMAYDDATDRWVSVSAANESYWTGLVRNSVTPVPAGSYTRIAATSGVELVARGTTSPGVDVTIPAAGLREELVKRAEAAARLSRELTMFDYVGGFTANTTSGSTAITNVSTITYPATYIGARISGSGIPANTTIVAVSGTTIYLSAAATATATGVSISFLDFALPVGFETKAVLAANAPKQEGATKDYTRLYDGFIETVRFAVAPGATAWVQIQAQRTTI